VVASKGDGARTRRITMNEHSREADWVHAYQHRVERDDGNTGHWYRRPGANPPLKRWMPGGHGEGAAFEIPGGVTVCPSSNSLTIWASKN
jgi:hypothetical protein